LPDNLEFSGIVVNNILHHFVLNSSRIFHFGSSGLEVKLPALLFFLSLSLSLYLSLPLPFPLLLLALALALPLSLSLPVSLSLYLRDIKIPIYL
jgi:hypothetical protein